MNFLSAPHKYLAFRIFNYLKSCYEIFTVESAYRTFKIDRSFQFPANIWFDGDVEIKGPGYINGPGIISAGKSGKIKIGAYCEIANNCHMRAETHVVEIASGPSKQTKSGKIVIGNNVWIGANVFINSGVTIGDGAVIGANSVVLKDVPPRTVVAGVPTREIRKLPPLP